MKVYITRKIPDAGIQILKEKGYEIDINPDNRPLSKLELISILKSKDYDAVLTLLTDVIDKEVMESAPTVKIYANFAIGFNNLDLVEAKTRNIFVTNTPGGGADRVAEHTWALILALTCRVVEGDKYIREGKYSGWDPLLLHGTKLSGKTLGIIGTGRIGSDVAHRGKNGFGMDIVYYDVNRNEKLESDFDAKFYSTVEEVLRISDVVSIHVPLLESTRHLINESRLALMKPTAYLINTSRGPVVDEIALVNALKNKVIRGAGLDVFEFEPKLADGLAELDNVVLTPHIASGTEEARIEMSTISAQNIVDYFEGRTPRNNVVQ
jgi:lactate dehydrogenase-like 2-hydroxyacid dehydrogenase